MSLTIVIPTYKRHDVLLNLVRYWKDSEFKVLILDGSPMYQKSIKKELSSNIKYFHFKPSIDDEICPQGSLLRRYKMGYELVKTEYVLLGADDEFYNKNILKECIDTLEKDKNYSSCMGLPYTFDIKNGKVKLKRIYKLNSSILDIIPDQKIRALTYFSNYQPRNLYSVCKTDFAKVLFNVFYNHRDLEIFAWVEMFYEISMTLKGSHKVLNKPYWIRGNRKKIKREFPVLQIQKYIEDIKGVENLYKLISELSNKLSEILQLSEESVSDYFKFCIFIYISNLPNKTNQNFFMKCLSELRYPLSIQRHNIKIYKDQKIIKKINKLEITELFDNKLKESLNISNN